MILSLCAAFATVDRGSDALGAATLLGTLAAAWSAAVTVAYGDDGLPASAALSSPLLDDTNTPQLSATGPDSVEGVQPAGTPPPMPLAVLVVVVVDGSAQF